MQHQNQLIRVSTVAAILDICKATVWAYAAKHSDFPKPIKVAAKVTRWKLSEINAYIESKVATHH